MDVDRGGFGNFKKITSKSPYREAGLDKILMDVVNEYTNEKWNIHSGEILFNCKKYYLINAQIIKDVSDELEIFQNMDFSLIK